MSTQTIFRLAGSTSQVCDVNLVQNAGATSPGDPFTTAAFNSSGLICYSNTGITAPAAVTLLTQTNTGSYSSGGFVVRDATHSPGLYRFDIPNALLTSVGDVSIVFSGITGMATHTLKVIVQSAAAAANVTQIGGLAVVPRYVGTATGGTASSITFAANTPQGNVQPGDIIVITGATGQGESNIINSTTVVSGFVTSATVLQSWVFANPDTSTTWETFKNGSAIPGSVTDAWSNLINPIRNVTSATGITSDGTPAARDSQISGISTLIGTPANTTVSADIAQIEAQTVKIGNPHGASIAADIAQVQGQTANIGTPVAGSLALDIASVQTKLGTPANGSVSADISAVSTIASSTQTSVSAIKNKTDQLLFGTSGFLATELKSVIGIPLQLNGSHTQNIGGP